MGKETKVLKVEGMSCEHCENTIKSSVGRLNGVDNVIVDLKGKTVMIEFDSEKVEIGILRDTIEDQGYEVR